MYNLAKLLTEEPEKLERLGILFLKLLVTLFIVSSIFGFYIPINVFVEDLIPKDYTIVKALLFLILITIIWFIVWTIIADLILGDFLIWLLSKIGSKKEIFTAALAALKIVKLKNENISPLRNVVAFNSILQDFTDEDEKAINDNKIRIRQYYLVALVIFITLIVSKNVILPIWIKWFSGIMIIFFLLVCVVTNQIHEYFKENLDDLKKQFGQVAYVQTIINALDHNVYLKRHFEIDNSWRRINLKRKIESDDPPETLKLFPLFLRYEEIARIILNKELQKRSREEIPADKIGKHFDVVLCNFKPDEEIVKDILSLPNFAYLHCENEEQIHKNLEIFLFKVTNGNYRIA